MPSVSRAIVQTGVRQLEMREFPLPDIGDDDGLLKVEACGICGSDWAQYQGEYRWLDLPVVPGHEPVGIVDRIGRTASQRWGLVEGDRVVVEPLLPCGFCRQCIQGEYSTCTGYGRVSCSTCTSRSACRPLCGADTPTTSTSTLTLVVHKIDVNVPVDIAALYNPLGSGIHWGVHRQGTTIGDSRVRHSGLRTAGDSAL